MRTKPILSIEDVQRLDVRVGQTVAVQDIEGSNSLVELKVDFGNEQRTILAGLKGERDDPGEITGRQALFVVNLEPRTMMGRVSEGMLFDIGYEDDLIPVLAVPETPVPNGSRAGWVAVSTKFSSARRPWCRPKPIRRAMRLPTVAH